jgi:hypothetical protein
MNFKNLFDKGKKIVDERGGVDSLKADAEELQGIAKGKGSVADKAKAAAEALKAPGAKGEKPPAGGQGKGQHQKPRQGGQGQHQQGQSGGGQPSGPAGT